MSRLVEVLELFEHHDPNAHALTPIRRPGRVTSIRNVLINPDFIVTAREFAGKLSPLTEIATTRLSKYYETTGNLPQKYTEVVLDNSSHRSSSVIFAGSLHDFYCRLHDPTDLGE